MPDLSASMPGWIAGGYRTPEELRVAGEVPAGDLPFPHRPGGHKCCWQSRGMKAARGVLERFASEYARESDAAEAKALERLVKAGVVDPWDDPAALEGDARQALQRETSVLFGKREAALRRRLKVGAAEELVRECDAVVDGLIARALPREDTYRGGLAALRRRHREGAADEDVLQNELDELRERHEVRSVKPLVGIWSRWNSAALRHAEAWSKRSAAGWR